MPGASPPAAPLLLLSRTCTHTRTHTPHPPPDTPPHIHAQGMDTYSNILFVKEAFGPLSHLAHRLAVTDKFTPEACCVVGNYYSLKVRDGGLFGFLFWGFFFLFPRKGGQGCV